MDLKITSIADAGVLAKERVVMKASASIDVGYYAIFRTFVRDGDPTTFVPHMFWMPTLRVAPNDLVVVYSKTGQQSTRELKSGNTAHFFYMHEGEPLWNDPEFRPMLVQISNWELFSPK